METMNRGAFHPSAMHRDRRGSAGPIVSGGPGANGAGPGDAALAAAFNNMSFGMHMPINFAPAAYPGAWSGHPAIIPQVQWDGYMAHPAQHAQALFQNANTMQGHGADGPLYGGHPGLHVPTAIGAAMVPFTPARSHTAQPRPDRGNSDVPGLENRRGSYSTTESTPATPYWAGTSNRDGARVASDHRSAYTTPSPQQLAMASIHHESSKPTTVISDASLDELLEAHPAIPKAVPAVFTPPGQMKTLEQSLENRIPGNRNVYIRGLHPTTDDKLLVRFTSRFGEVETSKAIIDTNTGACKGFGFAKFADVRDSEMCIRGFHRLGYEVGFARESFNSRLKAQGDDGSTNLYISNLPKTLNEVELGTIFMGYNILSSKILRDSMGNSRGVGFARFESRDICDEIIRQFNGVGIGEEGLLMNIRYADTPAQKELKRVTAERRQFRTNEYNIGAYGTTLVSPAAAYPQNPASWRRPSGPSHSEGSPSCHDGEHDIARSETQRGESQIAVSISTGVATSTSTLSECDESTTIHTESAAAVITSKALGGHLSPSAKKEAMTKAE